MSESHLSKKTCAHCGERKHITDFHRKAEMPDGRRGICKACIAEKMRIYRETHPETVAASKRRWVELNPERARAITRRYQGRNAQGGYTARLRERDPDAYARLTYKWAKRRADRERATPS